jgi:ferredoxin
VEILADQCTGCGVCAQMCNFDAILPPEHSGAGDAKTTGKAAS